MNAFEQGFMDKLAAEMTRGTPYINGGSHADLRAKVRAKRKESKRIQASNKALAGRMAKKQTPNPTQSLVPKSTGATPNQT